MPNPLPPPSPATCDIPDPAPVQPKHVPPLVADSGAAPLGLLPTPTPEEVAGFVRLYERKYGARLESAQAERLLAGLMRFLYLTRTTPPEVAAQPVSGAEGDATPNRVGLPDALPQALNPLEDMMMPETDEVSA